MLARQTSATRGALLFEFAQELGVTPILLEDGDILGLTPGTPTVIGKLSANSVYKNVVIGVYFGTGQVNGFIASIP